MSDLQLKLDIVGLGCLRQLMKNWYQDSGCSFSLAVFCDPVLCSCLLSLLMCLKNTHLVLHACGGGMSSHFLLRLSTILYRVVETKSPNINNQNYSRKAMTFQIRVVKFRLTKRSVASSAVAQN